MLKKLLLAVVASILWLVASPTTMADAPSEARDHAVVAALLRLPEGTLDAHPEMRPAVLRYLQRISGTRQYIEVAQQLAVLDQTDELTKLLTAVPFDNLGIDAAKLLVQAKQFDALALATAAENDDQVVSAIRALGYVAHQRIIKQLTSVLSEDGRSRQVRSAVAEALGRSGRGQQVLLDLAAAGQITEDILFPVTNALLGSNDEATRRQAGKYLVAPATAASETIPPIAELVKMRGDAEQGKQVFNTIGTCNKCHKTRGEGKDVGPDLSEIGSKLSRDDMYVAILNPSAAVSHNYETYAMLDGDGNITTGLLINKTDQVVTIRNAEGIDITRSADDIESLKMQSVSLMPADLQKAMSLQNLLDLVDYLVLLRKEGETPFHVLAGNDQDLQKHDPTTAIEGFEVAEGVEVQLFAAEPQLLSPTSIDVDHLGRVWVCEAVNYRHFRNPYNEERSEGDRILVLQDTNADGKADSSTVFYQGTDIDSPHGVCVLGNQVLVSAGANVFLFTDADGDLVADEKRILFSGIGGVQHDHGIHAFGVGPDGKLYFNFGNEGKQLKTADGETVVDQAGNVVDDRRNPYQQGMVFRCNPDGSELETLGWNFRNNWEVCVDSFGTLWQSDNDDDGNRGTRINFVMEFGNYGYRDELTGATWQTPRIGLESEIPLQHWHLNDPGVVPNVLQTGAGSPTGICFYEGDHLPKAFRNQMIHCDPGPNVVRAYPITEVGAGYSADILNLVKGSRDPWFRPVDVCAAPDGSLFIADWYDPGVGGHRMGDSKHGRIFRVVAKGQQGYQTPAFDVSTPQAAASALQSPNLATRYLAQAALKEFGTDATDALEALTTEEHSPRTRARAYWQLGMISEDPMDVVRQATACSDADLRIVGVRLARQHATDITGVIEQLKNDPAPQVRRELAIALRHNESDQAAELWAELALQHDGNDRWYLEALGIAADGQWDRCFDAWLSQVGEHWNTPAGRDIIWRSRSSRACEYLAKIIASTESEAEQYRYFRAFDFHQGPEKLKALTEIARR